MNAENFRTLLEIQSLENLVAKHNKTIASETSRITLIEEERSSKETKECLLKKQLEQCKHTASTAEKKLFDYEKSLEKTNEHALLVTSQGQAQAIQKELLKLGEEKNKLEDEILSFIEQQEQLESEIQACQNYLQGSLETLKEIQEEVDKKIFSEKKSIAGLEKRIKSLDEQAPSALKSLFSEANKNYRYRNPIAFLEKGYCNQCHYAANKIKEKAVDLLTSVETCEGCGRLLAPQTAKAAHLRG